MKFKLKSKFKPTGDQPAAINKLVRGLKAGHKHQTLLGVTGSGKTFTMANIINKVQKPTLIISHNKTLAAQLAAEFKEFFPDNEVHYFVSYYDYYQPEAYVARTDTYIEKETDINEEIDRLRHASTQAILSRKDVIIVASVSCIYNLGNPEEYNKQTIGLKINTKENRDDVLRKLVDMQYERNDYSFWRGTFRVKGDILEIFPVSSTDYYYCIEFLGDEIEIISQINSVTNKKMNEEVIKELDIYPAKHYVISKDELKKITKNIRNDLNKQLKILKANDKLVEAQRLEQRTNYDIEMIELVGYCNSIENYSRYFDGRQPGQAPYSLLDYFPEDFLIFIDESHMTIPQIGAMYNGDRARKETLIEYGFRLPSALDNRPLQFKEFEEKVKQAIYTTATPGPYEYEKVGVKMKKTLTSKRVDMKDLNAKLKDPKSSIVEQIIRPTGLLDPEIEIRPTKYQTDDLVKEIEERIKRGQRTLVTTLTKRMSEELAEYLQELKIKVHYLHSEVDTLERIDILNNLRAGKVDVVVGINLLREGLDLPEVTLVAILDADKEGFLRSETSLIQTMGRAARHSEGKVIMYADKITGSMERAIDIVKRRRKIQEEYNKKYNIKPKTIIKEIRGSLVPSKKDKKKGKPKVFKQFTKEEKEKLIESLTARMNLAARNLEFEKAAEIRDEIEDINKN